MNRSCRNPVLGNSDRVAASLVEPFAHDLHGWVLGSAVAANRFTGSECRRVACSTAQRDRSEGECGDNNGVDAPEWLREDLEESGRDACARQDDR